MSFLLIFCQTRFLKLIFLVTFKNGQNILDLKGQMATLKFKLYDVDKPMKGNTRQSFEFEENHQKVYN